MRSRILIATAVLLTIATCALGNEDEVLTQGAIEQVVSLHVALNELDPSTEKEAAYEGLAPVVKSTHDLNYIARFTLNRSWSDLSEDERRLFVDRFETLSIWLYIDRFSQAKNAVLSIEQLTASHTPSIRGDRAEVNTLIDVAEREIPLDYSLQQTDGDWRIINIIADGVSDLALRRSEYAGIIQDLGFDGLIKHLDQQILELESQQ